MFNDKDIVCWQNETVPLQSNAEDATYESATLLVGTPGSPAIYSKTASFDTLVADLTITDEETIPVGEYKYMVKVTFTDGGTCYFPDPETCSTDELPNFIVKERIEDSA